MTNAYGTSKVFSKIDDKLVELFELYFKHESSKMQPLTSRNGRIFNTKDAFTKAKTADEYSESEALDDFLKEFTLKEVC